MNKTTKKKIIRGLVRAVRDDLLAKVERMPASWDGIELRECVADAFDRERHMSNPYRKKEFARRLREYRNDRITLNLS
jgi:hypothetical protein